MDNPKENTWNAPCILVATTELPLLAGLGQCQHWRGLRAYSVTLSKVMQHYRLIRLGGKKREAPDVLAIG